MEKCSVCGSKGSTLTSTNDLDATQQARFEEQHPDVATGPVLCSMCVWYLQPALCFAKKTATSSVSGTNESNVTTPAKKTRPDQPKQPDDRKHIAKHVTVNQHAEKYAKYGLYSNNVLLLCKCCGKKVDYSREDSSLCWPKVA